MTAANQSIGDIAGVEYAASFECPAVKYFNIADSTPVVVDGATARRVATGERAAFESSALHVHGASAVKTHAVFKYAAGYGGVLCEYASAYAAAVR